MSLLKQAENSLAGLFKNAPKLSDNARETLVKVWPWLALIGGVLSLLVAWWLYDWARAADRIIDFTNEFSRALGGTTTSGRLTVWVWIAIALLAVEGILMLLAYPKLKRREKSGWDLLFLMALVNVIYSVVSLFIKGKGISDFIFGLLISAVGFWLLFETRSKYKGANLVKE